MTYDDMQYNEKLGAYIKDTKIFINHNDNLEQIAINYISKHRNLTKEQTKIGIEINGGYDGEDIYIFHKKTKSSKDIEIHVLFADWMVE